MIQKNHFYQPKGHKKKRDYSSWHENRNYIRTTVQAQILQRVSQEPVTNALPSVVTPKHETLLS